MTKQKLLNGLHIDRVTDRSGKIELRLCPAAVVDQRVARRTEITGRPECRSAKPSTSIPDSMVQLRLESDRSCGGFVECMTMQDSLSVDNLKHCEQAESADAASIVTTFEDARHNLKIEQHQFYKSASSSTHLRSARRHDTDHIPKGILLNNSRSKHFIYSPSQTHETAHSRH